MGNAASTSEGVLSAALRGDAEFISERMKESIDAVLSVRTGVFAGKKNVLHVACKTGQHAVMATIINPLLDAVTAEIESNVYPGPATALLDNIINHQDSRGRTALLAACYYGQLECAELLLEAGSNVFACDKDGNGVLHLAAIRGHINTVTALLSKADAQAITAQLTAAVNLSGFTPLHYAAYTGSADLVRRLAIAGVDVLQASWGEYDRWLVAPLGSTALHVAALGLKATACLALLQVHHLLVREWLPGSLVPTDPRTKITTQGHTPYYLAIWKGMPANCELSRVLNPRVALQAVIQQDSLQELAELRRKGPVSLRIIAAEAAKRHLLLQLTALAKQHQQQMKLEEQQFPHQHQHDQHQHHRRWQQSGSYHHSMLQRTADSCPSAASRPGTAEVPAAAAGVAGAFEPTSDAGRSRTVCSSASSCSKPCGSCTDAAASYVHPSTAFTPEGAAAAQQGAHISGSLLPGDISGVSFTGAPEETAANPALTTVPEQGGCITELAAGSTLKQRLQQQHGHHASAAACSQKSINPTCEIEAEPEDVADCCTVEVLTQASLQVKAKGQRTSDNTAALLLHMLSPGSLVASSCATSSSAALSPHKHYMMQCRRNSEPATAGGNESEVNHPAFAAAEAAGLGSDAAASSAAAAVLQLLNIGLSSSSGILRPRSRSTSSRYLNPRSSSFRDCSAPQLVLSGVSRGPQGSASGASALFSANRQHYARIMQEAHVDTPGTLSYRALARHSRTGSMTAATALAGALPGCISDRLAHCYENSSFIATTTLGLTARLAEAPCTGSMTGGVGPAGTWEAGSTVGGTIGSTVGGTAGSTVGGTTGDTVGCTVASMAGNAFMDISGYTAVLHSRCASPCSSAARGEVCFVCMDNAPTMSVAACGHELCHECAKCIVAEGVGCRPPLCPFCRRMITGFELAPLSTRSCGMEAVRLGAWAQFAGK